MQLIDQYLVANTSLITSLCLPFGSAQGCYSPLERKGRFYGQKQQAGSFLYQRRQTCFLKIP